MGRVYTASFGAIAIAALQDIFEVVAPSDAIVELLEIKLYQTNITGDSGEDIVRLQFTFGHTTSGSGGAAITARPHELGDASFGGTVERNNTTQATAGSPITREEDGWNVRVPYIWTPTPERIHTISPSARFVLELPAAPSASITAGGSISFEEKGG